LYFIRLIERSDLSNFIIFNKNSPFYLISNNNAFAFFQFDVLGHSFSRLLSTFILKKKKKKKKEKKKKEKREKKP